MNILNRIRKNAKKDLKAIEMKVDHFKYNARKDISNLGSTLKVVANLQYLNKHDFVVVGKALQIKSGIVFTIYADGLTGRMSLWNPITDECEVGYPSFAWIKEEGYKIL
jgi:hypothetical protein